MQVTGWHTNEPARLRGCDVACVCTGGSIACLDILIGQVVGNISIRGCGEAVFDGIGVGVLMIDGVVVYLTIRACFDSNADIGKALCCVMVDYVVANNTTNVQAGSKSESNAAVAIDDPIAFCDCIF